MVDLNALELLAMQATPRPWIISSERGHIEIRTSPLQEGMTYKDAAYVGDLITAAPHLIGRIRELEKQKMSLVKTIANDMVCAWCWLGEKCPYYDEENIGRAYDIEACQKRIAEWAEQAAKEAADDGQRTA